MPVLLIEIGFSAKSIEERWRIPIKKCFNIPTDEIKAKSAKTRKENQISAIIVGRDVSNEEIMAFCKGYFYGRDLLERVLRMRLI